MTNSVLQEAADIIVGKRNEEYGSAEDSFARIASLWSAYTKSTLTESDVAHMMILLKIARATHSSKRDNYTDICGYAALAADMGQQQEN